MKSIIPFGFFITAALLQLFPATSVKSQDITIRGSVRDTFNKPLAGAIIKVKGHRTKAYTDSTGTYSIAAAPSAKLIFYCKGFVGEVIQAAGKDTVNARLVPLQDNEVNTGYGIAKQSQTSLSASTVDKKTIEKEKTADITQLLQTLPGVKVVTVNGELKILIRSNINTDNYAFVILNGDPFYGSLRDLNRDDIKSIDVLKDPSETAAYGSRGIYGVVLITTK